MLLPFGHTIAVPDILRGLGDDLLPRPEPRDDFHIHAAFAARADGSPFHAAFSHDKNITALTALTKFPMLEW